MPAASKISGPACPTRSDTPSPDILPLYGTIPEGCAGWRLDKTLARLFPEHSRSTLQRWIRQGQVTVGLNKVQMARKTVQGNERVCVWQGARPYEVLPDLPENIVLDIIYEDAELIVLNKAPGLVVHPGAGQPCHTLLNALLHHDPRQVELPRAGIVHRLDKDTSGLMVVARTPGSYNALVKALKQRQIKRMYEAIVHGKPQGSGTITAPLGRHPTQRTKMAVRAGGKSAVTHYRVLRRYSGYTHLEVELDTGRTHQIRVHLSSAGYPLIGDPRYGRRASAGDHAVSARGTAVESFPRQALHACGLQLRHPKTDQHMCWQIPAPDDMQRLENRLRTMCRE